MTKKKDKEVIEEVIDEDLQKGSEKESWEDEGTTGEEPEIESVEDATPLILTDVEKFIIDTLTRLEGKFDKTFNNHTLIHGRFRRGRKTLNR